LTIARRRRPSTQETQEETMHPVIIGQLAADHIREIHAKAEDERRGRRARRTRRPRPPFTRPGLPTSDDPRRAAGQRPTWPGQLSAPPPLVMAGSRPDSGEASTERSVLDHGH
jgi:hypothetical protein